MDGIYFDNAATSFPKAPGVGTAMAEMVEQNGVNIGRGGYESAYELAAMVMDTRMRLKKLFHGMKSGEVCFSMGVTQSINQFLKGLLRPGDHIVVSSMEHNAVMRPLYVLQQSGVEASIVPCRADGTFPLELLECYITENTKAVLCTHASNVCGTILPVKEIGEICRKYGLFFAVDAAQTAGILPIDVEEMNIDFLAFPGHKGLRGPQGVGGFWIRNDLAEIMVPLMEGGTGSRSDLEVQPDFLPDKFESGTLPLPAIAGLHQALLVLEEIGTETIRTKEEQLTRQFLDGLAEFSGIRVAGIIQREQMQQRLGVVSVDFGKLDNAQVAFYLEQEAGIMTRVGLHCAPSAHKTLGTFPQGTVRFSFGPENTKEEVEQCLQALRQIL